MSDLGITGARVDWLEQGEADVLLRDEWLSSAEVLQLERLRIPKRRADWRLGRWTAKRAAATVLGLDPDVAKLRSLEIRPLPSGAPRMFRSGEPMRITISLSHRAGRAVCAISRSGAALGCDLEIAEPRSPAFISDYFSDDEQRWLESSTANGRSWLATLLWSAKESALKAIGAGLRMDTRDLRVDVSGSLGGAAWHPITVTCNDGRGFEGWWKRSDSLLRTVVGAPGPAVPEFVIPQPLARG